MTFDVDVEQINSRERQYEQFRRILRPDDALTADNLLPSDKYKSRDIVPEEMFVESLSGEPAPVVVLPVAEMPSKTVYGYMDPLEGSPAREMTKKALASIGMSSLPEEESK